jgi:hypothetical protein
MENCSLGYLEQNSRAGSIRMTSDNPLTRYRPWRHLGVSKTTLLTSFQLAPAPNDNTEVSGRTPLTADIEPVGGPVQPCGNCQQGARRRFPKNDGESRTPCKCTNALNPNQWARLTVPYSNREALLQSLGILVLSVRGCRSPPTSRSRAVAVHSCLAHTTCFQAPTIACRRLGLGLDFVPVLRK